MALPFENISFNDALFSKLKKIYICLTLSIDENNASKEICDEIIEKDVKLFMDYFSSMSNTGWINYKTITPKN